MASLNFPTLGSLYYYICIIFTLNILKVEKPLLCTILFLSEISHYTKTWVGPWYQKENALQRAVIHSKWLLIIWCSGRTSHCSRAGVNKVSLTDYIVNVFSYVLLTQLLNFRYRQCMWVSHNVHVSQNIILLLILHSHFKNVLTILISEAIQTTASKT